MSSQLEMIIQDKVAAEEKVKALQLQVKELQDQLETEKRTVLGMMVLHRLGIDYSKDREVALLHRIRGLITKQIGRSLTAEQVTNIFDIHSFDVKKLLDGIDIDFNAINTEIENDMDAAMKNVYDAQVIANRKFVEELDIEIKRFKDGLSIED